MMSRPFIHDAFLLESDTAVELYACFARDLPIIDYHGHLSAEKIASGHRFRSLTELWLEGDHYKWRAMRANGIPERLCSGTGSDWEKFEAWARTVPELLRNPLHHWTHMELKRPFGIDALLSPQNARAIFERCNERLVEDAFACPGLLETFRVVVVFTTDDPADALEAHTQLARRPHPATRVYPTWRPDAALAVEDAAAWNAWIARLEAAAQTSVTSLADLLEALDRRHAAFHALGCRASDHGLASVPAAPFADADVRRAFDALRARRTLEPEAARTLASALLHRMALMDHARGWVQQLHLGALRGTNTRLRGAFGADAGCDSIGDLEMARPLASFLDALDQRNALPKTILYNVNPRDSELLATMAGNFQDGLVPGKMQYGPAWWFLDQRDGIEAQLRTLSNVGLLSRFVGMATDSRSFLSFSRHDYFRRILCNLLAEDVRRGLVPEEREPLGRLITDVCFANARSYFGLAAEVAQASLR
jgi:glucuronate isomerase